MTAEPVLQIVSLYDDAKGRKLLFARRKQLLESAVKHVREGSEGTRAERVRIASDISGIPRWQIEVETNR